MFLNLRRVASSGMLHRVALIRTGVSEELSASIIRVTRIGELGTLLAVTSRSMCRLLVMANIPSSPILVTLMMEALSSNETSVLTRATRHNIPEDDILHSHHCENLKSYFVNLSLHRCPTKWEHPVNSCHVPQLTPVIMNIAVMMFTLLRVSSEQPG
jgi:hypothetical protein